MLIQFAVKNFRSFKDEAVLSLAASAIKELRDENTLRVSDNLALLKSAVIYGANASGKSNLIQAMKFMKWFVLNSSKETQVSSEKIKAERFKLHTETEKQPSVFEIIFIYDKIQYRYGFAVTEEEVVEEWLYYVLNKQELEVFTREKQKFDLSRHFKSEERLVQEKRVRPNVLFLSVSAQFNGAIANKIMEWFSAEFKCISSINSNHYGGITLSFSEQEKGKKIILDFLKRADVGIENFKLLKTNIDYEKLPAELKTMLKEKKGLIRVDVKTEHKKYDSKGKTAGLVDFDMNKEESYGTQKLFELSGPIIDALLKGKILAVDELDARLHPKLVRAVCELFNSKTHNPRGAQLVFVSHNTNILDKELLRRDQIWFTEKDKYGASELFSLVEFKDPKGGKKVRNDASYERSYLKGIYGAVPCARDLEVKYGDG
ncbi:MAG: ATP-binding protein [Candidatus Omnitrophota bacterium]